MKDKKIIILGAIATVVILGFVFKDRIMGLFSGASGGDAADDIVDLGAEAIPTTTTTTNTSPIGTTAEPTTAKTWTGVTLNSTYLYKNAEPTTYTSNTKITSVAKGGTVTVLGQVSKYSLYKVKFYSTTNKVWREGYIPKKDIKVIN